MKVILKSDVKGSGKRGEVINAKDGYARNYLIRNKLAVEANNQNLAILESEKEVIKREEQLKHENALKLKEKITDVIVTVKVKSGVNGKLFGSITTKDIADAAKVQHGIDIDKHYIKLDESIKSLGTFHIDVWLNRDVTATLKVHVAEDL